VAENESEFRQGEIITGVIQYQYKPDDGDVEELPHSFVIIASQDCDLLQDHERAVKGEKSQLNGVLLYEANDASVVRGTVGGSDIWRRVVQNNNERYHALEQAPPDIDLLGIGIPDLIVDFRRLFTMTATDLLAQIRSGTAQRRCRLEMPYREQFQTRAAFYLQRVGVPTPHKIGTPSLSKQ